MPLRCGEEPVRACGEWMCGQLGEQSRPRGRTQMERSGSGVELGEGGQRSQAELCPEPASSLAGGKTTRPSASLGLSPHQYSGDNDTRRLTQVTVVGPSQRDTGSVGAPPSGVITAEHSVVPGPSLPTDSW